MAYKAMEALLAGRRQVVANFKAGKIKSMEARALLKVFDEQIKEEERSHKKAVANFHHRVKGRKTKWQS